MCPSVTNKMNHSWPKSSRTPTVTAVGPFPKANNTAATWPHGSVRTPGVAAGSGAATRTHLLLMVSITPKRMMMNMRRPAITPAIFTVLSTCFSGSTVLEFWVEAPWRRKEAEEDVEKAPPHG